MNISKKFILSACVLALAGGVFADEFDDYDYEEQETPKVEVGGKVSVDARAYVDQRKTKQVVNWIDRKIEEKEERYSFGEYKTEANPAAKLNFTYSGLSSDLDLKLKFDGNSLGEYKWDMLDEFTARAYVGNAQFEAGKMRVVWGKGDKLHVLDNFNANDYTDYIIPDYIDRRIAEPMLRAVYSTNSNIKVEGIYTPMMTADRLASGGVWQPKATKSLTTEVTKLITARLSAALAANDGATLAELSSFSADDLYPDTNQFKYGQAGVRTTFTVGSVDLGFSYYYGHNKQPSANLQSLFEAGAAAEMTNKINQFASVPAVAQIISDKLGLGTPAALKNYVDGVNNYLATFQAKADVPELEYDQLQVFGFEAAGILFGRLNSRLEVAYNLTKDIAGDDPWVHNNSIGWVAGFDIDLPIHNVNLNVQNNGKYVLNNDKIGKEMFTPFASSDTFRYTLIDFLFRTSYEQYDVDYDPSGCYTNNKVVVDITDTWRHEKIKLDLKGIYGIERGDLLIMPTLSFIIKDDWQLDLSGLYIWCKDTDSEFDGWERNSFAQIGVSYQF